MRRRVPSPAPGRPRAVAASPESRSRRRKPGEAQRRLRAPDEVRALGQSADGLTIERAVQRRLSTGSTRSTNCPGPDVAGLRALGPDPREQRRHESRQAHAHRLEVSWLERILPRLRMPLQRFLEGADPEETRERRRRRGLGLEDERGHGTRHTAALPDPGCGGVEDLGGGKEPQTLGRVRQQRRVAQRSPLPASERPLSSSNIWR